MNLSLRNRHFAICLSTVSTLAFALSACSGGGGGGGSAAPVSPLTAEQMAQLNQTSENVGQVTNWQTPSSGTSHAFFAAELTKADQAKSDVQNKVSDPSACTVKMTEPAKVPPGSNPSMPMDFEMGMTIDGAACPIAYSWASHSKTQMSQTSIAMNSDFSMSYTSVAGSSKLLDVQSYKIAMKSDVSGNQQGASGTTSGQGQIVSLSQGTIALGLSGGLLANEQGSTSSTVATMTYPNGLVVEFKSVSTHAGSSPAVMKYYLNGVEISKADMDKYSKSFGLDKSSQSSTSDSKPNSKR